MLGDSARSLLAALAVSSVLAAIPGSSHLFAQGNAAGSKAGTGWTPARTADGQPDIQGIWVNATITPFERPASLKDKPFLTAAEAKAIERAVATRSEEGPAKTGDVGTYNQFWTDSGDKVVSTLRTSLVIDPPDGRVPLRPEAEQRRDYNAAHEGDSFDFMSVWDRCITRGVPAGMFPAGYNNAYQIIQTPGFVVIHYEMIHEARIIRLATASPLADNVKLWNGDSRGRWQGNTLVVETDHFSDKGWIATNAAAGRIRGIPQSDQAKIVERFTPTDAGTIDYQVTIEDPEIYTRPWTVSIPLHRDPQYQIYEYACHEGNKAVEHVLRGARLQDKEALDSSPR